MDTPVTHRELEEFRKLMETENERLADEDKRQNQRLEILEKNIQQISSLATSTEKLAVNMENMLKIQKQQGVRLETLEARDGEMWRKVTGYIITAVIGIVVGFVFTKIGM